MVILLFAVKSRFLELPALSGSAPNTIATLMLREAIFFGGFISMAAVLIAAIDLPWRHFQHINKLKMTHQELKEETKESEGDPMLKSTRRNRAEALAANRMMSDVPKADIVIVNPSHYAVALKWERDKRAAPTCVAKGVDEIAARIRETAAAAGVPIRRDPPTARSIFSLVKNWRGGQEGTLRRCRRRDPLRGYNAEEVERAADIMKRAVLEKIVTALRAKKQNEQMKYGETKRRRDEAIAQAEQLKAQAAKARGYQLPISSAAALLEKEKFCGAVLERAKRRKQAAADLTPAVRARREKLEGALQREIVAEKLLSSARQADRKRRLDLEEQGRDMAMLARQISKKPNGSR